MKSGLQQSISIYPPPPLFFCHPNLKKLNKAFRILVQSKLTDKPATLVAVHKAKYFAPEPGQLSMGPGGFVEALEFASGIKAHVVGKVQYRKGYIGIVKGM